MQRRINKKKTNYANEEATKQQQNWSKLNAKKRKKKIIDKQNTFALKTTWCTKQLTKKKKTINITGISVVQLKLMRISNCCTTHNGVSTGFVFFFVSFLIFLIIRLQFHFSASYFSYLFRSRCKWKLFIIIFFFILLNIENTA